MKEIKLTQGKVALVDDDDFDWINQWKWCAVKFRSEIFYAVRTDRTGGKQTTVYMHRLIINVSGPERHIDHKDGDGLNNQKDNLRIATSSQNNANRKAWKNSSSKYLGVSWNKDEKKWQVSIMKNRKKTHVGYFHNEEEGAIAYNEIAPKIHGAFAKHFTI